MDVLISVVSVLFILLCLLLILVILLQSDKSSGMGILGGSSQSTFGSSTADIITRITAVMVGIFFIGALSLAFLESYKSKSLREGITGTSGAGAISAPAPADNAPAAGTENTDSAGVTTETGNEKKDTK